MPDNNSPLSQRTVNQSPIREGLERLFAKRQSEQLRQQVDAAMANIQSLEGSLAAAQEDNIATRNELQARLNAYSDLFGR